MKRTDESANSSFVVPGCPVKTTGAHSLNEQGYFNGLMESTKRGKKKVDLLHDGGEGPTFIHRAGILIRGMTSQLYHIDIIMISLITSSLHHTSVWYDVSMT